MMESKLTMPWKTRRRIWCVALTLLALGLYFGGLHGEYHSYQSSGRTWYVKTQYFIDHELWSETGQIVSGYPPPVPGGADHDRMRGHWRGFGMVWWSVTDKVYGVR